MKEINGVDIKLLADNYGTPLYVYDKQKFEENYNKLKNGFTQYYPKTKIHFSVKANSNINVLKAFRSFGAGADCSSPIEATLAKKAGFQGEEILYTGNFESYEDLRVLESIRPKINLDDIKSFKRLSQVYLPEKISFRINPGIGRGGYEGITTAGADAKFGVPYEKAYEAYKMAKDAGIKRFGIHMMTGSNNLEPYYFAETVDKLMKIAGTMFEKLDIVPEYFDIGGGFGIPYEDEEEELNVDMTGKLVSEIFKEKCEKFGFGEPELILEPGRYLAANAGYLITKVIGIKESYRKFAGIDAGMNTLLRPALYGANHRFDVYAKENRTTFLNICGQICENSDIFRQNVYMPEIEDGDILIIRDAGAYGYVMASTYNNRLRPPEVMIDNGNVTLIKKRETIEDVLRLYPED